ncbi:phage holin family protein [Methylobacterium sp. ID0610]|uniref:phage holin family protein n=1 Tax=Methylobacterium carpenticola TaxID=3344827 RepID=UPI0036BA1049
MLQAVRQASDLAVMELELLAIEIERIRRMAGRVGSSFGGGLLCLCCGAFLLLVAAVKALAWLTGSEVAGALIVAAPFILAAGGLGWWGTAKIRSVGRP